MMTPSVFVFLHAALHRYEEDVEQAPGFLHVGDLVGVDEKAGGKF